MKTKTIALSALGLLLVLGVVAYSTGSLGSLLQGRFTTAGSELTVELASNTPRSDIVIAGTADVPFATYQLTTAGEGMVVNKLVIGTKGDPTAVTTVKIGYTDSNGSPATATAPAVVNNATGKYTASFSGLDFYISQANSANLTIYGDVNDIGLGATSGDFVQLVFGKENFEAVGQTSGTTYSALTFTQTTEPNKMYVYETKPTLALSSTSPSGTRSVSANDNAFIFNVTAAQSELVNVEKLTVSMASDSDFNTAGVVTASLKDGNTTLASSRVTFTDASHASVAFDMRNAGVGEVAQGTTKTWTVSLDTATLLDEDAGVDDPLTFSIALGSAQTPGGLWWSDTNAVAKWLGYVTTTTLNSNTVNY